ncbi:MAG TPA: TonB-dependent receptor [Longimicrobium sp.]|nr:TonB-dependent receptor [Longimicrobium sp.]
MIAALALALLAAAAQDTAWGSIRGRVSSEPSGLPVARALVEVESPTRTVAGMADSTGSFSLRVPAGTVTFRIHHLEHEPHEMTVVVPPGGSVPLDVLLRYRPVRLTPIAVSVTDPRLDSVAAARPDVRLVLDHSVLDDPPPPVDNGWPAPPGDGDQQADDALYVRGSAADLKLVLLDGAPVYAPFHMGGLIDTFEPGVLARAQLYLGGAPARYDGGLSYVMDLSTRSGNAEQHRSTGAVDLVSARTRGEGPLPFGARYLASGRVIHGAAMGPLGGDGFPYDYADGLVRLDAPLGAGSLAATFFANAEGVRIDSLPREDPFARWANTSGSLRYLGHLEGAAMELTAALGRFATALPMREEVSGTVTLLERQPYLLNAHADRLRLAADFGRMVGPVRLRYGASFDRQWWWHLASQPELDRKLIQVRSAGAATGAYVDAVWQPTGKVVLRGGLRADAFSVGSAVELGPRASVTWLVGERAALTVAGGRYHQYVRVPRPLKPGTRLENFADSARIPTHLAVAGASHLSVGLDQEVADGLRLGLEGFYKRFHDLPLPGGGAAHNSGMDVWVRRTGGALTGWMGYSLGWSWSDAPADSGAFKGRHRLSLGASGPVGRVLVAEVRVAYGASLATRGRDDRSGGQDSPGIADEFSSVGDPTGVDVETSPPLTNAKAAPFLRVDAELSRTWNARLAGRTTRLTPYVRVLNALENRDELIYRYFGQQDRRRLNSLAALPVVPVVGMSWVF